MGLYTGTEGDDGEYAPEIADKVALADKVGTAASYVSTGDCVAGFVYSSDIYRYDGIEEAFVCPEDSHKPIVYPGAVAWLQNMPTRQGVYRLLPVQQEGPEDLGQIRL